MIIAHYNSEFYDKAETFIFNYISHLKHFHPIYFANKFSNLDLFPLAEKDKYEVPVTFPRRYSWPWLYYGIQRKIFGTCTTGEEIVLRQRNARLIHAHFGPQGVAALKMRGKFSIPVITTFYGYDVSQLARDPQWRERYLTLFDKGTLFLVEGEFMESKLIELGCPKHKIQIQRIAIAVDKIPFRPRQPKEKGEKAILLFSGRFIEKKGLLYALQALKDVRASGKEFELRIIGDGPLKPQIEAFIRESGLSQHVKLLGFLNYQDYLAEMAKADIFIHPSITAENGDSEGGAPTVILEAQASGMPVISTLHADIPNIVVIGKSALLSLEKDTRALAKNILHLLDHQNEWERMGQEGRNFVERFHDIKKEIDTLEEKYRSVLSTGQSSQKSH